MTAPATIWLWLVTMPNGEYRIVPLLGIALPLWSLEDAEIFRPLVEQWVERHAPGAPVRLAKLVEVIDG